jgi:hypothetical protein
MNLFSRKEVDKVLLEVEPEQTLLVTTTDTRYVFHFSNGQFYIRKVMGKDPRYGLVLRLNGRKNYLVQDLDLGSVFEYYHARLQKYVKSGNVTAISVKN